MLNRTMLASCLGILLSGGCGPSEPAFRGRGLADWVADLQAREYGRQVAAGDALVRIGLPAVPALIEALRSPSRETRGIASRTLSRIGGPAVPLLTAALGDPDREQRIQVSGILGAIGTDARESVPRLVKALASPDQLERWSALEALGGIGPAAREAVPAVLELLARRHGSPLGRDEKLRAIAVFSKMREDPDALVRQAAAQVLEKIRGH